MKRTRKPTSIVKLSSRADQERGELLAIYVHESRELLPAGLEWEAAFWPSFGAFTNLEGTRQGNRNREAFDSKDLIDKAFMDFAKAVSVERYSRNPSEGRTNRSRRLIALRLVERALRNVHKDANPLLIDWRVLNEAVRIGSARFAIRTAQDAAIDIQRLVQEIIKRGILPLDVKGWRHRLPTSKRIGTLGVGHAGDSAREAKLPDQEAVVALAEVFNRKLDPHDDRAWRDIFTTSCAVLLFAAPCRGSQIVRLPLDALYRECDDNNKEQVALRVGASKGFQPHTKWIVEGMVPAVERAIDRIRIVTEEARMLALHYEGLRSKKTFYRHSQCPVVDEDEPLTADQTCKAIGLRGSQPHVALAQAGLSGISGANTLRSLWNDWVLPRHLKYSPYFPYVSAKDKALGKKGGLKYSEALFCMNRNQLESKKGMSPVTLWIPKLCVFGADTRIHTAELGKDRFNPTIFERHNFFDEKGAPLGFKSHEARHMLNTEAQRVSLPDELIARWSGRISVAQNEVYDHRSTQERVDEARAIVSATHAIADHHPRAASGSERRDGPWLVVAGPVPRSCSDMQDIEPELTGLATLYGECYHDYAAGACSGFVGCLECEEHECVKNTGDDSQEKLRRIEELKLRAHAEIEKSRASLMEGTWGADEWLKVQEAWASKLEQLIAILRDSSLPDGSRVRLQGARNPTHLHRVLRGIARHAVETHATPEEAIQRMLKAIEAPASADHVITSPSGGHSAT